MERIAVGEDTGFGGFRLQDPQRFRVLGERVLAFESGRRERYERAEHHGCCDGDAELCHCPLHPWWSRKPNPLANPWPSCRLVAVIVKRFKHSQGAPPK